LSSDKEINKLKRRLNPNLPKKVCPDHFHLKDFFNTGDGYRFYFEPETNRPRIVRKSN
jgi:hypothetical protein